MFSWWHRLPIGGRFLVGGCGMGAFYGLSAWRLGGLGALLLLALVGGALLVFLLINWLVRRSEKRKGQQADKALRGRMSRAEGGGIDESQEEQDVRRQMEQRWRDVYGTLKERGYDYYSFPWYLIIGPAQSGKTTSIQKSDQEFPIGDKPVVDYGGTRGCNWFFTNKAILIDTAGRYVDHLGEGAQEWNSMLARDQEEWHTFLDLLRNMRARSPINGVILTIKVGDLLVDDPRGQEKLAETLRRALLDIEERLKVRVPVYILITMCDKLIGFVDFFRHLPGLADRTLFGWSRPGGYEGNFDPQEFQGGFSQLGERVDRLLVEFLEQDSSRGTGSPSDLERIDRLSSFPEEFATLGPRLKEVLARVFAPTAYNENHFFRGVYFTSGVQEGQPVLSACQDLVADRMGSLQEDDISEIAGESKAYFIADLYEEKVFGEAGLVRLTKRAQREQRRKRIAYMGGAAVIGLLVTFLVGRAAMDLWGLARDPLAALSEAVVEPGDIGALSEQTDSELLEKMDLLARRIRDLDVKAGEASAFSASKVAEATDRTQRAYRKLFTEKVFGPLLGHFLETAERTPPAGPEQEAELADALVSLFRLGLALNDEEDILGDAEAKPPSVERLVDVLGKMGPIHNRTGLSGAQLQYERIRKQARALDTRAENPRAAFGPLARLLGDPKLLARIQALLRDQVLGYWSKRIETVKATTTTDQNAGEGDTSLADAWLWSRLKQIDGEIRIQLRGLMNLLGRLEQVPSLEEFDGSWKPSWNSQLEALSAARADIEALAKIYETDFRAFVQKQRSAFRPRKDQLLLIVLRKTTESESLKDKALEIDKQYDELEATADKWNQASRNAEMWRQSKTWKDLEAWDRLIQYVDSTPEGFLQPKADGEFAALGRQSGGVDATVRALLKGYEVDAGDREAAQPEALEDLLSTAQRQRVFLENRAVTLFLRDLGERLAADDGKQFLDSLALDTAKYPGDARYSSASAKQIQGILIHLLDLCDVYPESSRRGLWREAKSVRATIEAFALIYQRALLGYWHGTVVADYAVEDRKRLRTVAGSELLPAYRSWHDSFQGFERLVTMVVKFAGEQDTTGRIHNKLYGKLRGGGTDLRDPLDAVESLWSHYSASKAQEAFKKAVRGIEAGLVELAASKGETDLLRKAAGLADALAVPDRIASNRDFEPDPFLDVLRGYARATREGLDARPRELFDKQWLELLERAREGQLDGKFPFVVPRQLAPVRWEESIAAWDSTRTFLETEELAFLTAVVADKKTAATVDTGKLEFVKSCRQLRDLLLPKDGPVPVTLFYGGDNRTGCTDGVLVYLQEDTKRFPFPMPFTAAVRPKVEWFPGKPVAYVLEASSASGEVRELRMPFRMPREATSWANLLAFCYAYPTGTPRTRRADSEDVRWILVPFQRKGGGANSADTVLLGVLTDPPLPAELPDLTEARKE